MPEHTSFLTLLLAHAKETLAHNAGFLGDSFVNGTPPTWQSTEPIIAAVLASGRRMIVSHPERYRRNRIAVEFAELEAWKAAGALLQVNVGSVFGDYGPGAQQLAWQAIEHGLADLVSTDHHADNRTASPRAAYARLPPGGVLLVSGPLLLGAGLPFEFTVHLAMASAALARRIEPAQAWTLSAYQRYADEVAPSTFADVVVRMDDPGHPAVVDAF